MLSGRPGKSEAELKASGAWRRDRHAARVSPLFPAGTPEKPKGLSREAARIWELIVSAYPPATLKAADGPMVESAARWYARFLQYEKAMSGPKPYRAAALAALAWKNYEKAAAHLGLSPATRNRLRIEAPPTPKDQKARFFA